MWGSCTQTLCLCIYISMHIYYYVKQNCIINPEHVIGACFVFVTIVNFAAVMNQLFGIQMLDGQILKVGSMM